jgi:hypothetical protein
VVAIGNGVRSSTAKVKKLAKLLVGVARVALELLEPPHITELNWILL